MKKTTFFLPVAFLVILPGCGREALPITAEVEVPFTSQAPAGDWSEPWQNACEETSVYMVSSFYKDDTIKRDEAIKNIKQIVLQKNKHFSVSKDESLQKISDLINILELPWTTTLVQNPALEAMKIQLAENHPIIVPVFAPALESADYAGGSPDYHVLVLTGYDDATGEFIVNDPGTKNGEGARFKYDIFMHAIHDLDTKNYQAGRKAVLFTKQINSSAWPL